MLYRLSLYLICFSLGSLISSASFAQSYQANQNINAIEVNQQDIQDIKEQVVKKQVIKKQDERSVQKSSFSLNGEIQNNSTEDMARFFQPLKEVNSDSKEHIENPLFDPDKSKAFSDNADQGYKVTGKRQINAWENEVQKTWMTLLPRQADSFYKARYRFLEAIKILEISKAKMIRSKNKLNRSPASFETVSANSFGGGNTLEDEMQGNLEKDKITFRKAKDNYILKKSEYLRERELFLKSISELNWDIIENADSTEDPHQLAQEDSKSGSPGSSKKDEIKKINAGISAILSTQLFGRTLKILNVRDYSIFSRGVGSGNSIKSLPVSNSLK